MIIISWTLLRAQLKRRRRPAAPKASPTAAAAGAVETRLRHTVDDLVMQLAETCRETGAHLETRIRVLNELVAEADKRIETLRRMAGSSESPATAEPAGAPAAAPPMPAYERIYDLADRGLDAVAIAQETGYHRGEVELILSLRGISSTAREPPMNAEKNQPPMDADEADRKQKTEDRI